MSTEWVHIDTAWDMVREIQEKLDTVKQDNTRAWERVAILESQLKDCATERERLSTELSRTYE